MPSVEETEPSRLVLDESSFDFRGLSDAEIEAALDNFNDSLLELRAQGHHAVACPPMWDGVECVDGCELYQYLSREYRSDVDRDTLLLTASLLYNCPEWEPSGDIVTSVTIDGGPEPTMALSVAYALGNALARRGTACMLFRDNGRQGFRPVSSESGSADIFFFISPAMLPHFWRHLFVLEDVAEHAFFALGAVAFPHLILHPDLSFSRFDGAYRDLRDRVVTILAALSDYFAHEYQQCQGLPYKIQAAMGQHHVDLSPESPSTRGSNRLMRQREKEYGGHRFTCEWHAKLEPHRNRVHFAVPASEIDGKILVGIFVDHLDT